MTITKIPLTDKKLFVVTDIHGNLEDFLYYFNLWLKDKSNHICFCGDLIHGDDISNDGSLDILELVRVYIDYPTFHCLLGNHEWAQILDDCAYRYDVNQVESFKDLVKETYPDQYSVKYQEYKKLLQKFKPSLMTSNGLFIIHSGIHEDYLETILNNSVDIYQTINYSSLTTYDKQVITETLWCRKYDDYSTSTIDEFLKNTKNKIMISGHTIADGYTKYGNQLIFDSSYNTNTKYYLQIPLNKTNINIKNIHKYLHKKI